MSICFEVRPYRRRPQKNGDPTLQPPSPLGTQTGRSWPNLRINCSACGRSWLDLMYSCRECEDFHLHKSCAELPLKTTHHPFHPFHPLPLVFSGPTYACCGCGQWDSKLLYWCRDCNFTPSPDCALKPTTKYEFVGQGKIQHFLHEHALALMKEDYDDICSACKRCCSSESYSCHHCPSSNFTNHVLSNCCEQSNISHIHNILSSSEPRIPYSINHVLRVTDRTTS